MWIRLCLAFPLVLGACTLVQAQSGKEDLYYDALSGRCYQLKTDQTLRAIRGFPRIAKGRAIGVHLLNVNTLGKKVAVNSQQVSLFREEPSIFSPSSLITKVAQPTETAFFRSLTAPRGGADPYQSLKTQIDQFNQQCAVFKEISTLDSGLRSMAAFGEEPKPIAGATDPRQPGIVASSHMALRFKAYMNKLFSQSSDPAVAGKGAAGQAASTVSPDDIQSLADSKALDIKTTFTQIQTSYKQLTQSISGASKSPTVGKSAGAIPDAPAAPAQPSADATSAQQQVDQAFTQAQQNVNAIDLDASARASRMQAAAALYKQLTTQNIYEYDGPSLLTPADELVFTIQVFDANVPLPPPIAQSILSDESATATPSEPPAPVASKSASSTSGGSGTHGGKKAGAGGQNQMSPFPSAGGPDKGSQGGSTQGDQGGTTQKPEQQYQVPVYFTGRLKIDFSTGVFASNLTNGSYTTVPVTGGGYKIVNGATDEFAYGIGGLMHVYITSAADVVPALSLGLAQNLSGGMDYLLGASLMTGLEQRFILSFGLAGAQVERINGYHLGDVISTTSVPTAEAFRLGMFLAFTYNLK